MFDEESKQILNGSIAYWNQTEKLLKKVELLGVRLVLPAVTELRYAGRKLVDYCQSRLLGETMDISRKHIYDYEQCCIRARHDAVDAAVLYMKGKYNVMVDNFEIDTIVAAFPHHVELKRAIRVVDERLQLSREERHRRIDLYAQINDTSLDDLISKFNELTDSEDVIKGLCRRRDNEHRLAVIGAWAGVIGVLLAIMGVYLAVRGG